MVFFQVLKQLPSKYEEIKHLEMGGYQRELYDSLRTKFSLELQNNENDNDDVKVKVKGGGASMLMQLRQACNHPLLHRNLYDDEILRKMAAKIKRVDYYQHYYSGT